MYPPGFAPAISCDQTHWCAALTIDSLQAHFGALHGPGSPPNAIANPNCPEPVNFAFLTHSGRPVGPPGPDQQTNATFTPTPDVLLMNPGDKLTVSMLDTPAGYFTQMTDLTTHESGFMTASVATASGRSCWIRSTSPATARLTRSTRCITGRGATAQRAADGVDDLVGAHRQRGL